MLLELLQRTCCCQIPGDLPTDSNAFFFYTVFQCLTGTHLSQELDSHPSPPSSHQPTSNSLPIKRSSHSTGSGSRIGGNQSKAFLETEPVRVISEVPGQAKMRIATISETAGPQSLRCLRCSRSASRRLAFLTTLANVICSIVCSVDRCIAEKA